MAFLHCGNLSFNSRHMRDFLHWKTSGAQGVSACHCAVELAVLTNDKLCLLEFWPTSLTRPVHPN